MVPNPEQLKLYTALAVMVVFVIVLVALVISAWWYYAEQRREDQYKTDLYRHRVADRRRIIDRRSHTRSQDHE